MRYKCLHCGQRTVEVRAQGPGLAGQVAVCNNRNCPRSGEQYMPDYLTDEWDD